MCVGNAQYLPEMSHSAQMPVTSKWHTQLSPVPIPLISFLMLLSSRGDKDSFACLLDARASGSRAVQSSVLPQQQLEWAQQDVEVFSGQHEYRGVCEGCHCGSSGLPPQQCQLPKVHGGPQPHHLLHPHHTRLQRNPACLCDPGKQQSGILANSSGSLGRPSAHGR